jgi:hypothetical protein
MRFLPLILLTVMAMPAIADTENVRLSASSLVPVQNAGGASGGATRPSSERELMFRVLDVDGDGFVSKAEAAGNSRETLGFDRADRNRDGKLSFAEYDSIGKPRPTRKKSSDSASAGGSKKKKN